jgi:hypothetical protein
MELSIFYDTETNIFSDINTIDLDEVDGIFLGNSSEQSIAGIIVCLYTCLANTSPSNSAHLDSVLDMIQYYNGILPKLNKMSPIPVDAVCIGDYEDTCGCCESDCYACFGDDEGEYKQSGYISFPDVYYPIDETLIKQFLNGRIYLDNRNEAYYSYCLLDILIPNRDTHSNIMEMINNEQLVVNNQINKRTIEQRLEYIERLTSLIETCPTQDILFLKDSISIETSRLECMVIHHPKADDFFNVGLLKVAKHTHTKQGIFIVNKYNLDQDGTLSIIGNYTHSGIDPNRYSDLTDIIYYTNKHRSSPLVEITSESIMNYGIGTHSNLYPDLVIQIRRDTIESIMK